MCDIQKTIKNDLKELVDEKYKDFHKNLCPGTNNILGVRVPVLRKYAKEFYNKFSNASYEDIDTEFYEEIMLRGMLLGLKPKTASKGNIEELSKFIKLIDNWAVCDICTAGFKFIKKEPDAYWLFIKKYSSKTKEFEKRFAYVAMLDYYMNDTYIDEVLQILINENSEDYYVYMAVAWALSVALIKYYDKTKNIIENSNLNTKTYNKAIQKACESYRITQKQKEELREMKR